MADFEQCNSPDTLKDTTSKVCANVQKDPKWTGRFEENLSGMRSKIEDKQPKPLYSINADGFPQLNHQPGNPDEEALSKAVLEARTSGRATGLQEAVALINAANAPKQNTQELKRTSEASSMYNSPLYAKQNAQPKPQHTSSSEGQKNSADLHAVARREVPTILNIIKSNPNIASLQISPLKNALVTLGSEEVKIDGQMVHNLGLPPIRGIGRYDKVPTPIPASEFLKYLG